MRRSPLVRIVAELAALSVVFSLAVPAPAWAEISIQAIPDFVFNGSGWGHGIGMSQYGAQGYAIKGWTAEQIITHYFQGSDLGTVSGKLSRCISIPTPAGATRATRASAGPSGLATPAASSRSTAPSTRTRLTSSLLQAVRSW